MTPLATARADAVICRSAARALRRGDRPGQVAAMLCTYAGLRLSREPRADYYAENLAALWDYGDLSVAGTVEIGGGVTFGGDRYFVGDAVAIATTLWDETYPPPRRRWWMPRWSK